MAKQEPAADAFARQYRPLLKDVIADIARNDVANGGDADEQARAYAERGKPDFVLAYLLVGNLSEAQKREIYAYSHERRADNTEERARAFGREFHRPFPLLRTEAAKDRALARQIRAAKPIGKGVGRQLPTL